MANASKILVGVLSVLLIFLLADRQLGGKVDSDDKLDQLKDEISRLTVAAKSSGVSAPANPPPPPPPPPAPPSGMRQTYGKPGPEDEAPITVCSNSSLGDEASSGGSKCKWKFIKYHASQLEKMWFEEVDTVGSRPCDFTNSNKHPYKQYFDVYRDVCKSGALTPDQKVPRATSCKCNKNMKPEEFDQNVFSRFEYYNPCTQETKYSYIEPLAGVLRHPEHCTDQSYLLRKDWLLVEQWNIHKDDHATPNKRNLYFDAGASTWGSGIGGASQSWFDATFGSKCVDFDGFWMWEVIKWEPQSIFRELPQRVHHKYHWYNIPASTQASRGDSPVFHLKHQAKEEDFVLVKIDVDNSPVELAIIDALLADPEALKLVDEFFWEHHINMEPLKSCCWMTQPSSETQRKSITLFRKFREAGVRAHSWV